MARPSPIDRQWTLPSAVMTMCVDDTTRTLAVATADGVAQLLSYDDDNLRVAELHNGATLSLARGIERGTFIAGGEDGRLVRLNADDTVTELAKHQGKWLEQIAVAPKLGQIFYAVGKDVHRIRADGTSAGAPWTQGSTVGSIAVHPQEKRLAVAQYNGVNVYPLNVKHAEPMRLEWKGAHVHSLWHPAGDIVVTTMQEAALHGWRLSDKAEMRMSGYEAKCESIAFAEGGRYLASGGSQALICWPFFGGGPWGKTPLALDGGCKGVVTQVAAHPSDPLIATAYEEGGLALIPLFEGGPLKLLEDSGDRVSSLLWSADGQILYAGTEGGQLYRFTVDSVSAAFTRGAY